MTATLKPETAARIAALAGRLGYAGPDAAEQVIIAALDYLEECAGRWERWYTDREIAAIQEQRRRQYVAGLIAADATGKPLSELLQDDLYDEFGLPK